MLFIKTYNFVMFTTYICLSEYFKSAMVFISTTNIWQKSYYLILESPVLYSRTLLIPYFVHGSVCILRWGDLGSERLNNLPKVTKIASSKASIPTQLTWLEDGFARWCWVMFINMIGRSESRGSSSRDQFFLLLFTLRITEDGKS